MCEDCRNPSCKCDTLLKIVIKFSALVLISFLRLFFYIFIAASQLNFEIHGILVLSFTFSHLENQKIEVKNLVYNIYTVFPKDFGSKGEFVIWELGNAIFVQGKCEMSCQLWQKHTFYCLYLFYSFIISDFDVGIELELQLEFPRPLGMRNFKGPLSQSTFKIIFHFFFQRCASEFLYPENFSFLSICRRRLQARKKVK